MFLEILDMILEKDETKKESLREKLDNETLPFYLSRLDNIAKENGGHLALKRVSIYTLIKTGT